MSKCSSLTEGLQLVSSNYEGEWGELVCCSAPHHHW